MSARPTPITRATLRKLPLPSIDGGGDKESRGRVLIVGGSTQVPGALVLAGIAALRVGAGKLQMATVRDAAIPLALSIPEALVTGVASTRDGEISAGRALAPVLEFARRANGVLIGPGMLVDDATRAVVIAILGAASEETVFVLDGAAIAALAALRVPPALRARITITPHAGEMATLLGARREAIEADPERFAREAAHRFGVVAALKGSDTYIASPDGALHRFHGDCAGLGTSGSGDVLAGAVAGFAARGASPLVATVWGVWTHGHAGKALEAATAPVGFLAREIAAELPRQLAASHDRPRRTRTARGP